MSEPVAAEESPKRGVRERVGNVKKRLSNWLVRRSRPLVLISAAVLILGALLAGMGIAQLVFPRTVVAGSVTVVDPSVLNESSANAVIPDMLGLDEPTARRVLTDAGLDLQVHLASQPAAGLPGLVVTQEPAAGAASGNTITLTLSVPAMVPDVVGVAVGTARASLEALGAVVIVSRLVDPNTKEGTVVTTEPAVGEVLGRVVTLAVADPGEALSLALLRKTNSSRWSSISGGFLNGILVEDSPSCQPKSGTSFSEWTLGRHAVALEATLGLLDKGDPGSATIRIIGDGIVLAEAPVSFGSTSELRVDIRGVLRLRIEVIGSGGSETVVIGNGRILAVPADIPLIQAGS